MLENVSRMFRIPFSMLAKVFRGMDVDRFALSAVSVPFWKVHTMDRFHAANRPNKTPTNLNDRPLNDTHYFSRSFTYEYRRLPPLRANGTCFILRSRKFDLDFQSRLLVPLENSWLPIFQ